MPLESLGLLYVGHKITPQTKKYSLHLNRIRVEELAMRIDEVHSSIDELLVQLGLEADRVITEDKSVDVEPEGHGRIPELTHAVQGLEAPR